MIRYMTENTLRLMCNSFEGLFYKRLVKMVTQVKKRTIQKFKVHGSRSRHSDVLIIVCTYAILCYYLLGFIFLVNIFI